MVAESLKSSWLSKRFAALASAAARLSRRQSAAVAVALVVLVAVLDWLTGPNLNLTLFYLLTCCFASWCLGATAGFLVGVVTIILAAILNGFHTGFPLPRQELATGQIVWNTVSRLTSTSILVILAAGLRGALDLERQRAETDILTGVLNKSAFIARMDGTIARARARGAALVLGYIDLDGFKAVNDLHGHAAGDALLCAFAHAGAEMIRGSGLFARFGGDEFVLLLTVPDCKQGDKVAEALHGRLATILQRTGYPVTCSMGVLVLEGIEIADCTALIDGADRLMYEVKRSGKNAIRIARRDPAGRPADSGVAHEPVVRSAA
jgi:diguanylate cyclase (GGDEF)-like protein